MTCTFHMLGRTQNVGSQGPHDCKSVPDNVGYAVALFPLSSLYCNHGNSMLKHRGDNSEKPASIASIPGTLLPSPLASFVSLATAATSISLRIGGFLGHSAISAARVGSLSGVELGRAVLESVLFRAGHDVVELSTGRLGKVAAEGVLESAVSSHHGFASITQQLTVIE